MTYYTPETFNADKYKKTSWKASLNQTSFDKEGDFRLVIRVATGRKYWPMFSEVISPHLGANDGALKALKFSLNGYTHPMIDRFILELNDMLTDIYKTNINLYDIKSGIKIPGYYSSRNF